MRVITIHSGGHGGWRTAAVPTDAASSAATLLFLDQHAFDTLSLLGEQIVPGSRAAQVPAFLDRLLSRGIDRDAEAFHTGAGRVRRRAARGAHGKPWKMLTNTEATACCSRRCPRRPVTDALRRSFDALKSAVAESYYASEAGMTELGWNKSVVFAPAPACS